MSSCKAVNRMADIIQGSAELHPTRSIYDMVC
jgi:hypothetical protein